ncbi:MAG: hypothetical protein GF364_06910 [Candidatus Lokiarchaeota archaeon]|nr:hypothetical protein [Candidatus Lokiarchaeota archaeon]
MSSRGKSGEFLSNLRAIILKAFLTILLLTPVTVFMLVSYFDVMNEPDKHRPWVSWYDDPAHQIYIGWETEDESIGTVYLGEDPESLSPEKTESTACKIHHINIEGLNADTLYFYDVRIDDESIGKGQFRTAPTEYTPFSFAMTSDTQQPKITKGHHYRIAKAIENRNYTFLSIVGDHIDSGDDKQHFNNFFKTASIYADTIPFVPVIGNHDERGRMYWFTRYYPNSINKTVIPDFPNGQFYWSFNWSNVHFTNCHFTHGYSREFTDTQMDWLENDLKSAKDMPFRIVSFHCPIVGSGFYGRNENLLNIMLPLLKQYNVSAVISGHEHHWERGLFLNEIHPDNDITYLILGGGGGAFDPGLRPQPETIIATPTPCYTEVAASSNSLTFRTLTLEGNLIDTFFMGVS